MTQTQNEAEFEFEWLLRQKYEFKILTLIAVLADNNLAYRGTLNDMCGCVQHRKLCAIGVPQKMIFEVDSFSFEFPGMILH